MTLQACCYYEAKALCEYHAAQLLEFHPVRTFSVAMDASRIGNPAEEVCFFLAATRRRFIGSPMIPKAFYFKSLTLQLLP